MMIKRIIYAIIVLLWMITVFSFSSQNGEESQGTSDVFTYKIMEIFNLSDKDNAIQIKEWISFIIRKFAHFGIYCIGGFFIYGFFDTFNIEKKKVILFTIMSGMLYACFDEIHQSFVLERAGQIRDVLIDTSGICFITLLRFFKSSSSVKE